MARFSKAKIEKLRKQKRDLMKLVEEKKKVNKIKLEAMARGRKLELEKARLKKEFQALKREARGRMTIREKLSTPQARARIKAGKRRGIKAAKKVDKYLRWFADVDQPKKRR